MRNDFDKLPGLIRKVLSRVTTSLRSRRIPAMVGRESAKIVKTRTRKGFGITNNEGKKQRLKKLENSTKKTRTRIKRLGQLSSETSPRRSNFTRTGKTLDNIKVNPSNSKVEVTLDSHGKQAVRETSKISDKFNFMGLSKSEVKEIKKQIEAELQKALKDFL